MIMLTGQQKQNDYSYNVTDISDIKTLKEVLDVGLVEDEIDVWGDHSEELYQEALETGVATVYCSKDLDVGGIVSLSQLAAEEYVGVLPENMEAKVVAIDDVAWIGADVGRYAPVREYDKVIAESKKLEPVNNQSSLDQEINKAALKKDAIAGKETKVDTKAKDLAL